MSDKLQNAREYILRNIESAEFKGGQKLPSARDLAERTGISFTIMQMAFNNEATQGSKPLFQRHGAEHIEMSAVKTVAEKSGIKLIQDLHQG